MIPKRNSYWLKNAHVPVSIIENITFPKQTREGLCLVDIERVHELKQQEIPVTFARDNCCDPFYIFGDNDVLEVFNQAVKIAHLDTPYGDWICIVTKTAVDLIGLQKLGRIGVGLSADLICFKARYFSELLSRNQPDRIVLRNGKQIDIILPDYAELDDLMSDVR
ncbi:MAG: amidohydrolase family protein [Moorea sp. SIO2B7]|nr:amidohydrolase family protein [Moorena sp. SIO2B7]